MGYISILARRLKGGYIQYGRVFSRTFRTAGMRLLSWYDEKDEDLIEYLFSLGDLGTLGVPGSEKGGVHILFTNDLKGTGYWIGKTEKVIFSRDAFIHCGYFYDFDEQWYYIIPGPFRIKIPLNLIGENIDEEYDEYDFLEKIDKMLIQYIFKQYPLVNDEFKKMLPENVDMIFEELINSEQPIRKLWDDYYDIFDYFDDWVVVEMDDLQKNIRTFKMKKKSKEHIETIYW